MNLLIFYKLLKKLRLMSIKINRLEKGHNSYPLVCRRLVETVALQRTEGVAFLKPCCKSYKILFESVFHNVAGYCMFHQMHVSDIGR